MVLIGIPMASSMLIDQVVGCIGLVLIAIGLHMVPKKDT